MKRILQSFPMHRTIPERDWKLLREFHQVALNRFCERVLHQIENVAGDTKRSFHDRYLAIYKLINEQDDELSRAFDDSRRSNAFIQLAIRSSQGLLTEEEIIRFSPETREVLDILAGPRA